MLTKLFTVGKKRLKALLASSIEDLWIFLNCLVDFHGIWYECDAVQGDLDAIIYNPMASIILKWPRFRLVR
jgi:hypothetical protein